MNLKLSTTREKLGELSILMNIHTNLELEPINTGIASYRSNKDEIDRLNKIYQYTFENYRQNISLEDVAAVANLSVTSFCRYFKMMTKKTFNDFLIEIRISHARRLLIEEEQLTTEGICFECGFNNRSNFFRHFKSLAPFKYN